LNLVSTEDNKASNTFSADSPHFLACATIWSFAHLNLLFTNSQIDSALMSTHFSLSILTISDTGHRFISHLYVLLSAFSLLNTLHNTMLNKAPHHKSESSVSSHSSVLTKNISLIHHNPFHSKLNHLFPHFELLIKFNILKAQGRLAATSSGVIVHHEAISIQIHTASSSKNCAV
jgi:hypothetical protein